MYICQVEQYTWYIIWRVEQAKECDSLCYHIPWLAIEMFNDGAHIINSKLLLLSLSHL